jgi:electron transport complex protein RnfB
MRSGAEPNELTRRLTGMSYTREDVLEVTGGFTGVTIPVHVEIEATQVVLAQPEMRDLLEAADVIAVGDCVCREEKGKCDNPRDVCIALDDAAAERVHDRSWRTISVADALAILEKTYELGLVHLAFRRGDGDIDLVCSCCTCCCQPLNGLRRFDYRDGITESAFVARFDGTKCVGCGTCVERCPFDAFEIPEGAKSAVFDSDRCFGCGLCVGSCPSGALRLEPRDG